ncbi:MAG: hypothetical protein EKK29_17165 [Hyphomicrobiales bacterium]|nr:MAG: hypothetical protein EKK29_17165 [Hyphomicrobiales bacterium]
MPFGLDKDTVAIIVTIVLFFLGILINAHIDRGKRDKEIKDEDEKQRNVRKRYLMALREEIAINVKALDKSISMTQQLDKVEEFLRASKANRPLITYTYFSTVFSSRTDVLQDLDEKIINGIVDFYGKLSELKTDIDGLESKAFEAISDGGRSSCLRCISEESKMAKQQGDDIIRLISLVLDPKNIRAG